MPEEILMKNYGLVIEPPVQERDFFAGTIIKKVLMPSGQWDNFIQKPTEYQKSYKTGFDSYGCVSFSLLNVLEALSLFHGEQKNFSDNFTAVDSGTRYGIGNSQRAVVEAARKRVVNEVDYPFQDTRETFYKKIPGDIYDKSYEFPFFWEWGHGGENLALWNKNRQEVFKKLLTYAPVQITLWAYSKNIKNGIYQPADTLDRNHAVTLYGYEEGKYWKIYDHYEKDVKKLAWNYNIGSPLLITLDGIVSLVKKYEGKLIKNVSNPKYYFSNGESIIWISSEEKFNFGVKAKWWKGFDDVQTVKEQITENLIF